MQYVSTVVQCAGFRLLFVVVYQTRTANGFVDKSVDLLERTVVYS
jgi:hypothetical protein